MSNPKVSVIFPVYNGEKFVRESLQSILDQTFVNFEIVLIDDGSADDTHKILSGFSDSRIRLLRNQKNEGLIYTLNRGISEAKGEYLARMDADDISFPVRFEKQVKFLDRHPEVGVCGTFMTCNITDRIYRHRFLEPELVPAALAFNNPIVHPSVMMRRNLFTSPETYYNSSYPHAEDYALWISLISRTKTAVLPEVLIRYGAHDEQMSRKFNDTTRSSVKKAQEMIFKMLEIDPSPEEKLLHSTLFFEEYRKSESYIAEVEMWMKQLIAANGKTKIFDQTAFAKITGEWWFRVNQELSAYGFGGYSVFKKSSLSQGFDPGTKSLLKLRVKSILRSKK